MLWPLRICALRIDLCDGMLSGQLACAWAREPEVNDGEPYQSLCMLSVSWHSLIIGDKEPEPGTQTRLQSPLSLSCVVSKLVYVKVMFTNIRTYSTYVCGVDLMFLPFTTRDNKFSILREWATSCWLSAPCCERRAWYLLNEWGYTSFYRLVMPNPL